MSLWDCNYGFRKAAGNVTLAFKSLLGLIPVGGGGLVGFAGLVGII